MTPGQQKLDLQKLSRAGQAELNVALSHAPEFRCVEVVRRIADRRLVCRGTWNEQPVYAKLFIGDQAQRYAGRDLRGVRALTDASLLTPALLHAGPIADGAGEALIFAAVDVQGNAEDEMRLLAADDKGRFALMLALTRAVAAHHQSGLLQTDLYLKNLLVQGERVFTLDGDGIRALGHWLRERRALSNLAQLFSKMDVVDDVWVPQLYEAYCQSRGIPFDPSRVPALRNQVLQIRRKVVADYADQKVFRNCTDVQVQKTFGRFLATARPWVTLIDDLNEPDALLDTPNNKRLKTGNTCTVSLAEVDGRKVVVKRYNIKNFWHGLSRALRPTRAAMSWSNAHRLMMYGIATAAPVVLLEKRCGFIRRQAYFLAEYIDAPDAAEFFADAAADAAQKAVVANNIASLFYKLYRLKIEHGDFKVTNMKMVDGQPFLIDLDSLREHRCHWTFDRRHVRDLRRFMRNWQQDKEVQGMLGTAFRSVYKDTGPLDRAGIK